MNIDTFTSSLSTSTSFKTAGSHEQEAAMSNKREVQCVKSILDKHTYQIGDSDTKSIDNRDAAIIGARSYQQDIRSDQLKKNTLLLQACRKDDLDYIQSQFRKTPEILNNYFYDEVNRQYVTLLDCACENGCLGIVQFLIERGADINAFRKDGTTNLGLAVYKGHNHVVEYLLSRGVDVNKCKQLGAFSPVWEAVSNNNETALRLFIQNGVDLNEPFIPDGLLAIHKAILHERVNLVKLILDNNKTNIDRTTTTHSDYPEHTPLMLAALVGNKEIAELLIAKGANLHARNTQGRSASWLALEKGHLGIFYEIIKDDPELHFACLDCEGKPLIELIKALSSINEQCEKQIQYGESQVEVLNKTLQIKQELELLEKYRLMLELHGVSSSTKEQSAKQIQDPPIKNSELKKDIMPNISRVKKQLLKFDKECIKLKDAIASHAQITNLILTYHPVLKAWEACEMLKEYEIPKKFPKFSALNRLNIKTLGEVLERMRAEYIHTNVLVDLDWTEKLVKNHLLNCKVLEVCGGAGLLAKAIRQHDVDIICTDLYPWGNTESCPTVIKMSAASAVQKYNADVLLISFPPLEHNPNSKCVDQSTSQNSSFASSEENNDLLKAVTEFKGKKLVFIGREFLTSSRQFMDFIKKKERLDEIAVPNPDASCKIYKN